MNQLLCIVGPTGTGKTQKAIELSREQPSILVSADSRQVYRGMDIVTGKDHPKDVPMFGIDIINPDQPISVAVWYDTVIPHINKAWDEGKQVIVVGGTGLYVKALTEGIGTMQIPINQKLRDGLATLTIEALQSKLSALDPTKYASMNHSDQYNPRRLVRAIEIISGSKGRIFAEQRSDLKNLDVQIIGLRCIDDSNHRYKINERVMDRIKQGAIQETESLLKKYGRDIQSMSAIGYKSIIKFLAGELSERELVESWVTDEFAYAKRQLTWFRKQPIIWYDVDTYGIT